jgi:N-acetylmuramoyl-L-alanine amidase
MAIFFIVALGSRVAVADAPPPVMDHYSAVYQGKQITLDHIVWQHGLRAVGVQDPGLQQLLAALGASLTWKPGEQLVLITTAEPKVIAFTVGQQQYAVGQIAAQASFAPFLRGDEVFLPLDELLAALSLQSSETQHGRVHVLQSAITSLDVRASQGQVTIAAFAGRQVQPRILHQTASQIVYEFDGVGSTLTGASTMGQGIANVAVSTDGTIPNLRTLVTVSLAPASQIAGAAPPTNAASPAPAGTQVTSVDVSPSVDNFTVIVNTTGDATYEWHRLHAPDDRFWLDIDGAHYDAPPRQDVWIDGIVKGVRVQQFTATSVRVALSLAAQQSVDVEPSADGIRIVVGNTVVADAPASGNGSVGSNVVAQVAPSPIPLATANVNENSTALLSPTGWKFAPRGYRPTNPRLIVIDPGHGGPDAGTVYRGVEEKNITLDVARRLRNILVARGWQVRMTRDADHDVAGTALSAKEATSMGYDDIAANELQARDDIANEAGARVFISIHVNECCDTPIPGPSGTTSYFSKPEDVPLARDVQDAIVHALGMKDDGIVKSRMYVTLHAFMPAVLVETAFLSNPGDFAHLESPQWRQRLAAAMADGIETYARENPLQTGANE